MIRITGEKYMEKWREVYTEEQINKIQQIELRNLVVIKEVCSKLGIEFFLYGGSLIGAVRHNGFIPWDDDLDIAMFRKDYEKFISEAPKYISDEYDLQTPYNTPKSPYPYTKLRLKGTKYVEYGYHKLNIEQGLYVDIYPIDNLPDNDELYHKQFKQYQRLVKLYAWRQCPYLSDETSSLKTKIKRVLKFCVSTLLKIVPQKYLMNQIDNVATRYNGVHTERKGNLNFPRPVNFFYNILPYERGEFNGISVNLPSGWDQHLTLRYGNYKEFPPEEKRVGHKPYLLDFGNY
jgi:lipopolysaccharide cholinephosphotransferase